MRLLTLPRRAARRALRLVYEQEALDLWSRSRPAGPCLDYWAVDRRDDLLLVEPRDGQTYEAMIAAYDRRLAEGWHVVTQVEDGRLLHSAWWVDPDVVARAGVNGRLPLDPYWPLAPGAAAYLGDDYTVPSARGRGLHRRSIAARMALAKGDVVTCAILGQNHASQRNYRALGFLPVRRLWRRRVLGSDWSGARMIERA
jgi:GNAT superfamily N-acetyltransferase